MPPHTHQTPHYAEGRTLRIVVRKYALAAKKRVRKILKRKHRERMEVPT